MAISALGARPHPHQVITCALKVTTVLKDHMSQVGVNLVAIKMRQVSQLVKHAQQVISVTVPYHQWFYTTTLFALKVATVLRTQNTPLNTFALLEHLATVLVYRISPSVPNAPQECIVQK